MLTTKHLTKAVGLAALAAAVVGFASPASASPAPPAASAALTGTWVNTNAATRNVTQVVITPNRARSVSVDAFGACVPTLCEWGSVPAITYGTSVSAPAGVIFQSRQRFLLATGKEWSRTTLLGAVTKTRVGLRLTLRELTVFEDGSGRKNYNVTETFRLGDGQKPTHTGNPVPGYVRGNPPVLVAGAFGKWKNVSPTGGIDKITIGGTLSNPLVQAFGRCSPTDCNWGIVRGIAYGASISSAAGGTLLAPYRFSFKNAQLVITYSHPAGTVARLTVGEYNEFTDGSGRSNYRLIETFVRA